MLQVYRVLLDKVQPHAAKVLRLGGDPKAQIYFLKVGPGPAACFSGGYAIPSNPLS
jgi:hypothetical protein